MEGQDPQAVLNVVNAIVSAGSPWAMLGALLVGLLRLLRLPLVQQILASINPKLAWATWPQWLKVALPFVLAAVAALITAVLAGGGWIPAVLGALMAGLSAVTLHEGTKAAGSALDTMQLNRNPEYQPGPLRKAVSPVLPVDEKAFAAKMMANMKG